MVSCPQNWERTFGGEELRWRAIWISWPSQYIFCQKLLSSSLSRLWLWNRCQMSNLLFTTVSTLHFLLLEAGAMGPVQYLLSSYLKICSLFTSIWVFQMILRQWHIITSKNWTPLVYQFQILLVFSIHSFFEYGCACEVLQVWIIWFWVCYSILKTCWFYINIEDDECS